MPFKIIYGVIGGSDECDAAFFDDVANSEISFAEFLFAKVPDLPGSFTAENAFIAEIFFQLKVAPMVHRVSDGFGKGFGKLLEFFSFGRIPGDVIFVNAV